MSDWKIKITETVKITRELNSSSYFDMSAEEAKEYEKNMARDDKIVNFAENLSWIPDEEINYDETIEIVTC